MKAKRKRVSTSRSEASSPSAPVAKFESISDKELLSIFSRLPLCDLQSLELVKHQFNWIVQKVYRDRKSLSLVQARLYQGRVEEITRYWYMSDFTTRHSLYKDCYRITRMVNSAKVSWFRARFPNVTQLSLYCVDHLSIETFVELIQSYPKLERLVLFSTDGQQAEYAQAQFWTALYGLRDSLCHLYLPFDAEHREHIQQMLPSILVPRLQSLYLNFGILVGRNVYRNVEQVGVIEKFDNFGMMFLVNTIPMHNDDAQNPQMIRLGLYITETNCAIRDLRDSLFHLSNIIVDTSQRYGHITHLDLVISCTVGLLSILPQLARLTQLTHLRLTERETGPLYFSAFFSELKPTNYKAKLGQPNNTQMPSVRHLNLYQFDIIPSNGIFLYLSRIFPQISTLRLEDCLIGNSTRKNIFPAWFLNSMARFGQLREVHYNYRLVLNMERVNEERDKLLQLIQSEMFNMPLI